MKPPLPPRPKIIRPIKSKPDRRETPMMDALIKRISGILENKGITQSELAEAVDSTQGNIAEYLSRRRSAPGGETTLRLLKWAEKQEKKGTTK